jgi:hypothetical protein
MNFASIPTHVEQVVADLFRGGASKRPQTCPTRLELRGTQTISSTLSGTMWSDQLAFEPPSVPAGGANLGLAVAVVGTSAARGVPARGQGILSEVLGEAFAEVCLVHLLIRVVLGERVSESVRVFIRLFGHVEILSLLKACQTVNISKLNLDSRDAKTAWRTINFAVAC